MVIIRRTARCVAALAAIAVVAPGIARAEVNLYQATVSVPDAGEAARSAGFSEALRSVAVRVSGSLGAASNAEIRQAAANPSRYVQQYSTTGQGLRVGFDRDAVDDLLLRAGLPLWPAERPVTLVLLATDSTGARALIDGEPASERAALDAAAEYRGIELLWPQTRMDILAARERAASGALRELARAAGGSEAQAVLIGVPGGAGVEWQLFYDGGTRGEVGSAGDGADIAADAFAARYATPATRNLSRIDVWVGNVPDLRSYAGLLDYLGSLSMVRELHVEQARRDAVRVELTMRGDRELLSRIGALDGRLQPAQQDAVGDGAAGVDFLYHP
jgi:hypothetical protein